MKIFRGELPAIDSHYGDPRGVAFDEDVICFDEAGAPRLLAGGGVKVSEAWFEAISAGLEDKSPAPEEPKKITPKENKNGNPPKENK